MPGQKVNGALTAGEKPSATCGWRSAWRADRDRAKARATLTATPRTSGSSSDGRRVGGKAREAEPRLVQVDPHAPQRTCAPGWPQPDAFHEALATTAEDGMWLGALPAGRDLLTGLGDDRRAGRMKVSAIDTLWEYLPSRSASSSSLGGRPSACSVAGLGAPRDLPAPPSGQPSTTSPTSQEANDSPTTAPSRAPVDTLPPPAESTGGHRGNSHRLPSWPTVETPTHLLVAPAPARARLARVELRARQGLPRSSPGANSTRRPGRRSRTPAPPRTSASRPQLNWVDKAFRVKIENTTDEASVLPLAPRPTPCRRPVDGPVGRQPRASRGALPSCWWSGVNGTGKRPVGKLGPRCWSPGTKGRRARRAGTLPRGRGRPVADLGGASAWPTIRSGP